MTRRVPLDDMHIPHAVTDLCLLNTNLPPADHTHVCAVRGRHDGHRCWCGSEWGAS